MRDLAGQTFGSYRLESIIGRGGMGEVYRARHLRLTNRLAAVKVLPASLASEPDFLDRFEQEANSAAALDHPAILPVWDYGEQDGQPYLAMPYVGGGNLKDYLERHGPFAPAAALDLVAPIAEALDYAHGRGIIHRDVKPANILLREDGRPLLADFGIAKAIEASQTKGLTRAGTSIGTPEYMAPEQIEGKAGPRSDLYALAVVAFQLLTGHLPYDGATPYEVAYKQLHTPLPPLGWFRADLPPALERVLATALAKEPEARYPDGRAFVAACRAALADLPVAAAVPAPANGQPTRRLELGGATAPLATQPPPPRAAVPATAVAPPPTAAPPRRGAAGREPASRTPVGLIAALIALIIAAIGLLGVYVAFLMPPAPPPTPPVYAAATLGAARTATAIASATAQVAANATVTAVGAAQATQVAAAQATQGAAATAAAEAQAATATAVANAQAAGTATVAANAAATAGAVASQTVRANNAATATVSANATAGAAQTATTAARPTATAVPPTATAVPPTATAAPPTQTPRPPTPTPRPPTATQATGPPPNWGPALAPLSGGKAYKDPQERFTLSTPNNWSERDAGEAAAAFAAPGNQASLAITIADAGGAADIDAFNAAVEEAVKKQPGYAAVALDKVVVDNHAAYRRTYKTTQNGQQLQVTQVYFLDRGQAHILTFATLPAAAAEFAATFNGIAGSYKVAAR